MNKTLEKKENLKYGEMIPLHYDSAFKIMYANQEHLEVLTVLLSKVLEIDYDKLEGNVTLLPLKTTNKTVDEKKSEKDIYVSVKTDEENYGIILEVNIRIDKFQNILERNIYYMNKEIGHSLKEGMDYDELRETILINFNNFFVNKDYKEVFEDFYYRDNHGFILSEKNRILNINIEECYKLWYTNDYQGKFEPYEEDLMLLCAAMMVEKEEDFRKIVSMVRMKPEIKELMEGLVRQMSHDEELVTEYKTWKNEEERIMSSIIKEVRRDSFNAGIEQGIEQKEKEFILNMYNDNVPLELISKYTKLTVDVVKKIIDSNNN